MSALRLVVLALVVGLLAGGIGMSTRALPVLLGGLLLASLLLAFGVLGACAGLLDSIVDRRSLGPALAALLLAGAAVLVARRPVLELLSGLGGLGWGP